MGLTESLPREDTIPGQDSVPLPVCPGIRIDRIPFQMVIM
jgi:hypothetical protein